MARKHVTEKVSLTHKNLTKVPDYLTEEIGIQILNLAVNKIKTLPPEIRKLQNLEELVLSNNELQDFPSVIGSFPKLHALNLAGNKLKRLSSEIEKLKNLASLKLGWNKISEFPEQLFTPALSGLKELHISNNRISSVPEDICLLQQLEVLDVSYNLLEGLPDDVCELTNLQTFKASNNRFKRLPAKLCLCLTKLKVFDVAENPLLDPPIDICNKGLGEIRRYQQERLPPEDQATTVIPWSRSYSDEDLDGEITTADRYIGHTVHRMKDGVISAHIDPASPEKHLLLLSPDVQLEVPPGAVKVEVDITAKFVEIPPCPLALKDHELLLTDFVGLGPDGFRFQQPLVFILEPCAEDLQDKTRDVVVRTTTRNGSWCDLRTWRDGDLIKAEVEHFTGVIAVSKPRQHSVLLTDMDYLTVSCVNDDVAVDAQLPKKKKKLIHMLMERQIIDHETLLRASELVGEYDDDNIAMGTILKIQQDMGKFSKSISLTLPIPELSEDNKMSVRELRQRGFLKVLKDCDDDNWRDVTEELKHHDTDDRIVPFTEEKLHWPRCRYATFLTPTNVNVEKIAKKATSMSRRGWKSVKFVLLQNIKNPKRLYLDCVLKDKLEGLIAKLKSNYEDRGTLPYSRDIDLQEGDKVYLDIRGENIRCLTSRQCHLTFYSRRDNHVNLQVVLGNSGSSSSSDENNNKTLMGSDSEYPDDEYAGYVDFLKRIERNNEAQKYDEDLQYDTLYFGIPKPVRDRTPSLPTIDTAGKLTVSQNTEPIQNAQKTQLSRKANAEGVDIAIDILSMRLLQREWRGLARKLDLSEADINSLEHNHPNDMKEQIYQMLHLWRRREGDAATVKTLLDALENLQVRNLRDSIKRCVTKIDEELVAKANTTRLSPAHLKTVTKLPKVVFKEDVDQLKSKPAQRQVLTRRYSHPNDTKSSRVNTSLPQRQPLPLAPITAPKSPLKANEGPIRRTTFKWKIPSDDTLILQGQQDDHPTVYVV